MKYLLGIFVGLSFALGALAMEQNQVDLKMQIFKDLQLVDEIESLNEGEASRLWLRSSDDEDDESEKKIKGLSLLGS